MLVFQDTVTYSSLRLKSTYNLVSYLSQTSNQGLSSDLHPYEDYSSFLEKVCCPDKDTGNDSQGIQSTYNLKTYLALIQEVITDFDEDKIK